MPDPAAENSRRPGAFRQAVVSWLASSSAPYVLLALAAFLCCGGPRIAQLGFYRDDWIHMEKYQEAGSSSAILRRLAKEPNAVDRPLGIPLGVAVYALSGIRPLGWHLTELCINILLAFCICRVLLAFRCPRSASLLAAMLFLAYPSKDVTLFWMGTMIVPLSAAMFLLAYLAHLSYVRTGRNAMLFLSALAFLASPALYDSCVLLAPLYLIVPECGKDAGRARIWRSTLLAFALTLLAVGYKRFMLPAFFGVPFTKTVPMSPYHAFYVYLASINANLGPDQLWSVFQAIIQAWRTAPVMMLLALLLPWLAVPMGSTEATPAQEPPAAARLVFLGLGFYVLGYVPVAVSSCIPVPTSDANRLNLVAVMGLTMILAGLFARCRTLGWSRVLGPVVVGLAIASSVGISGAWVEANRRQMRVRDMILEHLADWPKEDALLLRLPQLYIAKRASVFDHESFLESAVHLWTGDRSRRAFLIRPGVKFLPDGFLILDSDKPELVPYGKTVLLDYASGAFKKPSYVDFKDLPPQKTVHNAFAAWIRRILRIPYPKTASDPEALEKQAQAPPPSRQDK
ncbi:MAG: hypothetical protein HY922_17280 [Elusimicrobia bacterium]|nr:hypothetical protein [Elusimicrobiota bacterium]